MIHRGLKNHPSQLLECNWREFRRLYPTYILTDEEQKELLSDGYVVICPEGKFGSKTFTVRLEVAESEIPLTDFSKGEVGKFYRDVGWTKASYHKDKEEKHAGKRRKAVSGPKRKMLPLRQPDAHVRGRAKGKR